MSEREYQDVLQSLNMTEENADTEKVWAEIGKRYGWRWLIGSQEKIEITEEWKKEIWYCPSCKYWFL